MNKTKTKITKTPKPAHENPWTDIDFEKSFVMGLLLMALSLAVNYFASTMASKNASQPVSDLILSNLPQYNSELIIIVLSLVLFAIMVVYALGHPKKIPMILKSVAMFVIIRAIFINLTHLGPFSPNLAADVSGILSFNLGNNGDFFFSGHTGLPFLAALGFWKNKVMRNIFLAGSIILGTCVLIGHFHYSIDVFGAFFITYAIHHINISLFKKDWHAFREH
jgi:hypothetical protein